jgi:hypothetical protein
MAAAPKQAHPDDSQIEAYCLGKIPEHEAAGLEEHLLVCESCQQRVAEGDAYIKSMRNAGAQFRSKEAKPRMAWKAAGLVPVLGVALVVAGVSTYVYSQRAVGPRVSVALEVTRGGPAITQAPAGRSLLLSPDLAGLPELALYRLEMVDRNGKRVFQQEFAIGKTIEVPAQSAGTYFIRLYTSEGALLREFALDLQRAK